MNRIHFVINGKEGTVSFSIGAPDFCYGYVRLCSRGSDSKIQVTLMPEEDESNRPRDKVVYTQTPLTVAFLTC